MSPPFLLPLYFFVAFCAVLIGRSPVPFIGPSQFSTWLTINLLHNFFKTILNQNFHVPGLRGGLRWWSDFAICRFFSRETFHLRRKKKCASDKYRKLSEAQIGEIFFVLYELFRIDMRLFCKNALELAQCLHILQVSIGIYESDIRLSALADKDGLVGFNGFLSYFRKIRAELFGVVVLCHGCPLSMRDRSPLCGALRVDYSFRIGSVQVFWGKLKHAFPRP